MTISYSPVMIEHLFDEALVWSLREGRDAMDWNDIQQAKLTEEIGLKQPVEYSDEEKIRIATHEAGHAVVAHLVGFDRKLEVLSIIKRRDALGLLAHSDKEERWTKTRTELIGAIKIAFGGMVAEELFFGEAGTGPASDLAQATRVAATMVGSLGMAGTLVSYEAIESGPISQGIVGKVLGTTRAARRSRRCSRNRRTACACCSTRIVTSWSRCATRCWIVTSSSPKRSPTCCSSPNSAPRSNDRTRNRAMSDDVVVVAGADGNDGRVRALAAARTHAAIVLTGRDAAALGLLAAAVRADACSSARSGVRRRAGRRRARSWRCSRPARASAPSRGCAHNPSRRNHRWRCVRR
jgi:hypothetical protein